MSNVNPYPIDPEEFEKFLVSQGYAAVAGVACDDADCPLARFLNAQYPGSQFYVNMTEYRRNMDDISLGVEPDAVFPLPGWAQDFAYLVDAKADFLEGAPVSVFYALIFLFNACLDNGLVVDGAIVSEVRHD